MKKNYGLKKEVDITFLMPCKNEAKTLPYCLNEIHTFLKRSGFSGEIIVVNDHSKDASAHIAKAGGARVIASKSSGYGSAIRSGLTKAKGRFIIIGDCDSTYDFTETGILLEKMMQGYDLVIGDRFANPMERGAMPLSHHIGVRVLSGLGRIRFHTDVRDFHCGLRGITKEAADKLSFHTKGMEFATEMIAAASHKGLMIASVPVTLRVAKAKRASKLNAITDGVRHLMFILFDRMTDS